jgi:hypothetical protein
MSMFGQWSPPLIAAITSTTMLVIAITVLALFGAVMAALRPSVAPHLATFRSVSSAMPDARYLAPEPAQMRWLERSVVFVLIGYIMFDRPFAWIHVPGTPLFVGEMVIALGIWVMLSSHSGVGSLIRSSSSLKALRNFMLWGAVLLAMGILPWGIDAVRDSALWYYGIFAILVAILLVSDPRRVNKWFVGYARLLPIYLIWFPFATVLPFSAPQNILVPDSDISVFFHRSGNMAVLAAIGIAFLWMADGDAKLYTTRQRAALTTLATFVIVFTGLQNRGGMVASAVLIAALLFLLSKKRIEMVVMMIAVLVFAGAIGIVFDVRIALFDERDVSIQQFADNVTSIFNQDAGGQRQKTTTTWRLKIWTQVLNDVSKESPIIGFGMGTDIGARYGITTDDQTPLRNPHNSHVDVLARMGWFGAILWVILWAAWFAEMQTLRRRLRYRDRPRESAVVSWVMMAPIPILVNCFFDPTLEGAQVAALLWAFFGAGVALVVLAQQNRFPSFATTTWDAASKHRTGIRG